LNFPSWCITTLLVLAPHAMATSRPDAHAPISVLADHTHSKGEIMLSYRYMHMHMAGNRHGTDSLAPSYIATNTANAFFGLPGQPPKLRVVPTKMTMAMHMLGIMYAPSDTITLMAMANYAEKTMQHVTFQGSGGTTELGTFFTTTRGIRDSTLAGLIKLHSSSKNSLHGIVGLSLPTGNNRKTGKILTPMGARPSPRLPYPMQAGSGTLDLITGLTYVRYWDHWSAACQWRSIWRVRDNDEGYSLGNEHTLSTWASRVISPRVSISARLTAFNRSNIHGQDPLIIAPVQTADPNYQASRRLDAGVGINFSSYGGHRLALELNIPIHQDLDGPQLETDWQLTAGYQWSF